MTKRPAYYSLLNFPGLHEICENWEIIRAEFLQLNAPVMGVDRSGKNHEQVIQSILKELQEGKPYGWMFGWGKSGGNDDWIQYGITSCNEDANNVIFPYVVKAVPETFNMLSKIAGIKVSAFVTLKAHSMLHCHTHPEIYEEGLLQFHLPLVTATEQNYTYLNVMGEFRQHQCGEPIIFDGSLDHFAINESNEDRTVLYLEFKK